MGGFLTTQLILITGIARRLQLQQHGSPHVCLLRVRLFLSQSDWKIFALRKPFRSFEWVRRTKIKVPTSAEISLSFKRDSSLVNPWMDYTHSFVFELGCTFRYISQTCGNRKKENRNHIIQILNRWHTVKAAPEVSAMGQINMSPVRRIALPGWLMLIVSLCQWCGQSSDLQ